MEHKPKFLKVAVDGTTSSAMSMTLKEKQDWVGGYIEYAPRHLRYGFKNIICNEEGLMLGLVPNNKYPAFVGNVIVEL